MKKTVLWTSLELDLEGAKECLLEGNDVEGYSPADEEVWDYACDNNNWALDDLRSLLNIQTENSIILIADLGLWDGHHQGAKSIGDNLQKAFSTDCDDAEWYTDAYNLRCNAYHHDGCNNYLYRELKREEDLEKVLDLAYYGKLTPALISRYTRSVKPYIDKVYNI